jgi:hypothetical protein
VQAVKKLPLESPFKLRMVQVPRMKLEIIGVDWDVRILELDDDLHTFALVAGGEVEQRVLVQAKLGKHAIETTIRGEGHEMIVK